MSEQEEIELREKILEGMRKTYRELVERKAALGLDMVIADADGQPLVVPASEILAKLNAEAD